MEKIKKEIISYDITWYRWFNLSESTVSINWLNASSLQLISRRNQRPLRVMMKMFFYDGDGFDESQSDTDDISYTVLQASISYVSHSVSDHVSTIFQSVASVLLLLN